MIGSLILGVEVGSRVIRSSAGVQVVDIIHNLDGVLDAHFAEVIAAGDGFVYGIDSSAKMIQAARKTVQSRRNCKFEG